MTAAGALARFRETTREDLDFVLALEADPDTKPYIAPWSLEEHQACFSDPEVAHWIVETADTGRPVGFVIVKQIRTPRVELRRIAIAEKGRGFGRWALGELRRIAFEGWGADALWLDVYDFNTRAYRAYESEGFIEIGRRSAIEACGAEGGTAILMEVRRA